jgi:hypothetical protein
MWFGWSLSTWEAIFFWVTSAAAILGGLGLAAALFSAIIGYTISDVVTRESDAKIAESNARTKEAELKLALLERKIIPRAINDKQGQKIIEKINSFAHTPFAVESDPASEYVFVNRIIELLKEAGWEWKSYSTSLMSLPIGETTYFRIPSAQIMEIGIEFEM